MQLRDLRCHADHLCDRLFEGALGRPSKPRSRGLAAYLLLLRVPTLKLHDSLLISALLLVVQAAVCAMIFESGHELGHYPALRHALRTVACGSLDSRCRAVFFVVADSSTRVERRGFDPLTASKGLASTTRVES